MLCISQGDESCIFKIWIGSSQVLQAQFGGNRVDLGEVNVFNPVGLRVYIQGTKIAFIRDGIIWDTNGAGSEILVDQPSLITELVVSAPTGFNAKVLALSSSVTSVSDTQLKTIIRWIGLIFVILGSALVVVGIFWRIRAESRAVPSIQKALRTAGIVLAAAWIVILGQGLFGAEPRIWFSEDFHFSDFFQMQTLALGEPYHFEGSIYPPMGNLILRPTVMWSDVVAPTLIFGVSLGAIGASFAL